MAEIKAGQYVTDGTSVFILDDIRDGHRVGDIVLRPVLHNGFIKANGATVTASEYPRLLKFAQDNNLLVASDAWNSDKSKYVYDSGTDTLKIPDAQGRVLQGTADTVKSVEAGLPNITGEAYLRGTYDGSNNADSFVFIGKDALTASNSPWEGKHSVLQAQSSNNGTLDTLSLDASKSNAMYGASTTVQPPALTLIPQIKY